MHLSSDSLVSLRPANSDDTAFLFRLFVTTREEELAFLPLPPAAKEAFLLQQFGARTRDYAARYGDAENALILRDGAPIGRILIHRGHGEFRLVDIAILPEQRRSGIGTSLLRDLLAEAHEKKLPVRLSVLTTSAAIRLYERLGFRALDEGTDSVYRSMECSV